MPQKGTQRDSKREMDLACPRREGPCEAEEWGLSRLGQPQMTAGEEAGTPGPQHLGTAFCQQHELGRKSVPPKPLKKSPPIQHRLQPCHPREPS